MLNKEISEPVILEALDLIKQNKASCVLVKDGKIVHIEIGMGISPILYSYMTYPDLFEGATIVDKIVGKAAAVISILGKANEIVGLTMSDSAIEYLLNKNSSFRFVNYVQKIQNRTRTGICPIEQSVMDIDDPAEAFLALLNRLQDLKKKVVIKKICE
ncbi:hypothetical protein C5L30_000410 [Companilactobacillus farciminis]|uniref:DUF1893 domain-containing protein n=2 Tax=Companilactobacillus farciminis TaxID=1612 RepID=A0A4R5NFX4_9LACO|nr:DUF1893 domain-containing protein [Companilactobacillus farciminis]ATO45332.1 hypothetical protein LF20184_00530 [Companilactobacillus farciminis KCTC 3681 = DSM 20184]KRK61502.1 hypothetical protein FC68_GL000797 [Companilactobacillus farciminis KCTC 3681 = DSM 20184]TDG73023.1 hypothetical protein C5L30_000410 [Companilactobacillus farciminis]